MLPTFTPGDLDPVECVRLRVVLALPHSVKIVNGEAEARYRPSLRRQEWSGMAGHSRRLAATASDLGRTSLWPAIASEACHHSRTSLI